MQTAFAMLTEHKPIKLVNNIFFCIFQYPFLLKVKTKPTFDGGRMLENRMYQTAQPIELTPYSADIRPTERMSTYFIKLC